MKRFLQAVGLALLVAFAFSAVATAQGIPTGRLSGRVTDSEGNGVPGVAVEITSPSLQGVRTAVTDLNGDYVVPSLPPGEYTVAAGLYDWQTGERLPAAGTGAREDGAAAVGFVHIVTP